MSFLCVDAALGTPLYFCTKRGAANVNLYSVGTFLEQRKKSWLFRKRNESGTILVWAISKYRLQF
jgi:hypothetical protein